MEKPPEFYKQRETHRKKARELLPSELQLEYPIKPSGKKVGVPAKKLLSLRHSQDVEDCYFIEYLRSKISERKGKLTEEEKTFLVELEHSAEDARKSLEFELDKYVSAREAMQRCFDKGWPNLAGEIAVALGDLASARGAMQKCFDEGWLIEASKIAVALAEKDPASAKEAMQRCFDKGWLIEASKIAVALAEKDPASAKEAMQRCFDKGSLIEASKIAVALAESINFSKISSFDSIFTKHQIPEVNKSFVYASVRNRLELERDLGGVISEDLPAFQALKEYAATINSQLPEDKQSRDLEKYWREHQVAIANLFGIHRQFAENLIIQKMQQFGFSRLARILVLADNLAAHDIETLNILIQKTKNSSPNYLEKLLELNDAFKRMNLREEFSRLTQEIVQNSLSSQEVVVQIGKILLERFAKQLGIEAKISDDALAKWNLEYLSKLFFAERSFEESSREALKLIVKTTLQGDFEAIIKGLPFPERNYTADEIELIWAIQEHNRKVKAEFQKAGIDYDAWLHYPQTQEFSVGVSEEEKEKRLLSFERELSEVMLNILGSRKEGRPGILTEDQVKKLFKSVFKKYGINFQEGRIVFSKGKLSPLNFQAPLEDTIEFIKKELKTNPNEALGTNLSHLENLLKILTDDLQKEAKQKGYTFQIKLWDRQPGYDIFQGNYTHCCIAVENFNRAAILDYLTDTGINIIEIRDKNTDQVIAQTLVFMAQNQEGENILVLDNVEINNDYRGLSDDIRQHLFEYVARFADQIIPDNKRKIDAVLLGTAYNDIETSDLNSTQEILKKIGGAGPEGTQYLDSFGSAWVDPEHFTNRKFYVAMDGLSEQKRQQKEQPRTERITKTEIISTVDRETMRGIVEVEQSSFPLEMQSDEQDLRETFENPNGIHIVIRSRQGEVVGYISSIPQKDAYGELKNWDKDIRPEDNTLYIESIAVKPEYRDIRNLLSLGKLFIQEAKRRGFTKITMHARIAGDLSAVLQKRYGAKFIRRIENWHNFNEPFDYLEIDIRE
jgi:ribosomal protein S18 acetylase RimI-like enzyme